MVCSIELFSSDIYLGETNPAGLSELHQPSHEKVTTWTIQGKEEMPGCQIRQDKFGSSLFSWLLLLFPNCLDKIYQLEVVVPNINEHSDLY